MKDDEVALEFGKGRIAGYISLLLGVCGFFGVLCFRFPEYLTSEEFRAVYSVNFARGLLFTILVVAYFAGIVGFILKFRKISLVGMGFAFLASLLGGARIQVGEFDSISYSFGLDWFVVSLIFSILILIPIEKSFALNKEQKILRKGWRTDLAYFFVSHLLIQFIFLFATSVSEGLFSWTRYLPIQDFIRSWPIVIQFFLWQ